MKSKNEIREFFESLTPNEAYNACADLYWDGEVDLEEMKEAAISILEDNEGSSELKLIVGEFTRFYKDEIGLQTKSKPKVK